MTEKFYRELCGLLNRLLEADPAKAEAVAESGLLELANERRPQVMGPLVAHWHEVMVDEVSQGGRLTAFELWLGARDAKPKEKVHEVGGEHGDEAMVDEAAEVPRLPEGAAARRGGEKDAPVRGLQEEGGCSRG